MDKGLTIDYKLSVQEISDVSFYLLFRQPIIYIIPFALFLLMFSNLIFYFLIPNYEYPQTDMMDNIKLVIIPFFYVLSILFLKRRIKKEIEKNPKFKEKRELILSEEYIEEKGETYNVKYAWKDILKIKETSRWVLIFINKKQVIPIIKKDFQDFKLNEIKSFISKVENLISLDS